MTAPTADARELVRVFQAHGRGGAHRRSRADERALAAVMAAFLGRASTADSLRALWLETGFGIADRERLAPHRDLVFALDDELTRFRDGKLRALSGRADARVRAAEWWLKLACAPPSRRNEALLTGPVVGDALASALSAGTDPRAREPLSGALARIVADYFPDATHAPLLRRLVTDRHSGVRFFAVQGLGGLFGRGAEPADRELVRERLHDGSPGVREAAERALGDAPDF